MKNRCRWVKTGDKLYEDYHDKEWGVPVYDDKKIFEFLVLEAAQAGLSWRIILGRRAGYRKAFKNFDPKKVAKMTVADVKRLLKDPSIIRNRKKIETTINNAKRFLEVQKEFGTFAKYIWSFVDDVPLPGKRHKGVILAKNKTSEALAKDMKKRGFSFLGPVVLYSHMQATGMINDHEGSCFRRRECEKLVQDTIG